MAQTDPANPLDPALRAIAAIRTELTKRAGKPSGNLNQKLRAQLDTVEATLLQIVPIGVTMQLINQQTQLAVHAFRNLERLQLTAHSENGENGDDEDTTKGQ